MQRFPKLCVVGSSNTDIAVITDRLPERHETVIGGDLYMHSGGKGANQAATAARLGAAVKLIARVGADNFANHAEEILINFGIDTTYLWRDAEHPSGVALIMVDKQGHNSIVVAPGANWHLRPKDVDKAIDAIIWADLVVTQFEIPLATVERTLELAKASGKPIIVNPAPATNDGLPRDCYKDIDYFIPNEKEAATFAGGSIDTPADAIEAARQFVEWGAGTVIVTLGDQGCVAVTGDQVERFEAFAVEPVDSTAAGDCFIGALAWGLGQKKRLSDCLHFASAAAALSVTQHGAQSSLPFKTEVVELLRQRLPDWE